MRNPFLFITFEWAIIIVQCVLVSEPPCNMNLYTMGALMAIMSWELARTFEDIAEGYTVEWGMDGMGVCIEWHQRV